MHNDHSDTYNKPSSVAAPSLDQALLTADPEDLALAVIVWAAEQAEPDARRRLANAAHALLDEPPALALVS